MAYTILIETKEFFIANKTGSRTTIEPATYWLSDPTFTCFEDMRDWVNRQEHVRCSDDLIAVKHITAIKPFANCLCEN